MWRDTTRLVDELAAANPATLIVAGHTHRNRRYPVRGLTVSEVGSTKDYPGVWAGYSIYEGGIRQVVYRVAEPAAIAWTELTRRALGGIWGLVEPGTPVRPLLDPGVAAGPVSRPVMAGPA